MGRIEWVQLALVWLIPLVGWAGAAHLQLPGVPVVAIVGW